MTSKASSELYLSQEEKEKLLLSKFASEITFLLFSVHKRTLTMTTDRESYGMLIPVSFSLSSHNFS